jgi:hypothetical protein
MAILLGSILFGLFATIQGSVQAGSTCKPGVICELFDQAQPASYEPQLVVRLPTHAYTGPGFNYLNYGDLPIGISIPVRNISEDGNWWVIRLPTSVTANGLGWVSAADVTVKNVQVLSDWLKHCAPMTYCGYVLSQTQNQAQSVPDWLANCDPMTYCGYVLAHSPKYITVMTTPSQAPKYGLVYR